jgi:Recombination endonuclease VII
MSRRRAIGWKCSRVSKRVVCRHLNKPGTRKCAKCGKPRPVKRQPKHMAALDYPYEFYVEINGGEHCGVCGAPPKPGRRLQRDHDHRTGRPRGLLCIQHNRRLGPHMTIRFLRAALAYLERAERIQLPSQPPHHQGAPHA